MTDSVLYPACMSPAVVAWVTDTENLENERWNRFKSSDAAYSLNGYNSYGQLVRVEQVQEPTSRWQSTAGMLYVTGSAVVFAFSALGVSWIQEKGFSTLIVMQIRAVVQWLIATTIIICSGRSMLGPASCRTWLIVRGLVYWLFMFAWFKSLQELSLGEATTLVYTSPILTAAIGIFGRKEKIASPMWYCISIIVTMVGVVFITQPSSIFHRHDDATQPVALSGVMWGLTSAVSAGLIPLLSAVTCEAHWVEVDNIANMMSAMLLTPCAIAFSFAEGEEDVEGFFIVHKQGYAYIHGIWESWLATSYPKFFVILILIATWEVMGHALQTVGYQICDLVRANALIYIEVPISYFLQWRLLRQPVNMQGLVGAALILLAGGFALFATRSPITIGRSSTISH